MKEALSNIDRRLEAVETTVERLEREQSRQATAIERLKEEQSRQATAITGLQEEMHRLGLLLEDIHSSVKLLAEAVSPLLQHSERTGEFDQRITSNSEQIKLTQRSLTEHVRNKLIHRPASKIQ